MNQCRIKV